MVRGCKEYDRLERAFIRPRQLRSILLLKSTNAVPESTLRALESEELAALFALMDHRAQHDCEA